MYRVRWPSVSKWKDGKGTGGRGLAWRQDNRSEQRFFSSPRVQTVSKATPVCTATTVAWLCSWTSFCANNHLQGTKRHPSSKQDDVTGDAALGDRTCDCSTAHLVSSLSVRHTEDKSCIALPKKVFSVFHEIYRSTRHVHKTWTVAACSGPRRAVKEHFQTSRHS